MRKRLATILASVMLATAAHAQSTPPASTEARFVSIDDNALLSSGLIGLDVRNARRELIGKIEDLVFEAGQLVGIILEVRHAPDGAIRYVAVDPSSISLKYIEADVEWRATLNADYEQTITAPEFQYRGKWRRLVAKPDERTYDLKRQEEQVE